MIVIIIIIIDSHGGEKVITVVWVFTKVDFSIMQIWQDHDLGGGLIAAVDNQVPKLMVFVAIDGRRWFDFSFGRQIKNVFIDVEHLVLSLVNAIGIIQQVVPYFDNVVIVIDMPIHKRVKPRSESLF